MTAKKRGLGLGKAGASMYESVTAEFDLDTADLALLLEACRIVDSLDGLQRIVDAEGLMIVKSFEDKRIHPALVELRQQRAVLTRMLKVLGVGLGEVDEDEPAEPKSRSGPRGLRAVQGGK